MNDYEEEPKHRKKRWVKIAGILTQVEEQEPE